MCLIVHLTGLVQFFRFPLYIEWVQSTVMVANFVGQNESMQKNCHDGLLYRANFGKETSSFTFTLCHFMPNKVGYSYVHTRSEQCE